MKELKFEELSLKQKLGMTLTAFMNADDRSPEEDAFVIDLIKNHSLGAVWIQWNFAGAEELLKMVKDAADYPILIITDAGNGIGEYQVGKNNAIGTTGKAEYAYAFGKTVGVTARKMGYNIITNPVLDMTPGAQASLGQDKYKVTELAEAIARGVHDAGVLTMAKHYPSAIDTSGIDSHMGESISYATEEELLDYNLYSYLHLIEKDLLDGFMSSHRKLPNIDPEYPASLSKKANDIIRRQGFNGVAITDALGMMGIRAKYNEVESTGLAIAAGHEFVLPFTACNSKNYEDICTAYEQGFFTEERLDEAVKRILEAQHKAFTFPKDAELTEEELANFNAIDKSGVYAKTDEGFLPNISRNGNHYFVIMARCDMGVEAEGRVAVDTFSGGWYFPFEIEKRIKELFPNSKTTFINEFPTQRQNCRILEESLGCDEVVFITFCEMIAYLGPEHLTRRFVSLIKSMQLTDRITTLVHFGNPFVLEELPHIPRVLIGGNSKNSTNACIDVLAGDLEPMGVPTYNFKLQ